MNQNGLFNTYKKCYFLVIGAILLISSPALANRDPFQIAMKNHCQQRMSDWDNILKKWKLLGGIGQNHNWVSWVLTVDGNRLALRAGMSLLEGNWQVISSSPTAVEFVIQQEMATHCQTIKRFIISLE